MKNSLKTLPKLIALSIGTGCLFSLCDEATAGLNTTDLGVYTGTRIEQNFTTPNTFAAFPFHPVYPEYNQSMNQG